MKVVAYLRVSTERQAAEGNSLAAQQAKLVAYATAMGLEIVAQWTDGGQSAGSLDRPGLQQALAALERGEAQGILVTKLDRLTRSVRDLCDLVDGYFKDDYALLSVGESIDTRSAAGRMMLNMLTVIGQWEREAAAERTIAVMAHMKTEGMFTGGFPPYGYRIENGALIAHPAEQEILQVVRLKRALGHSLRNIAADLGVNHRTGKPFAASQIARML